MVEFLKETIKWKKFELLIDIKIYKKDIIFKTAYLFLDKWYFFFKNNNSKEMVVQFTLKEWEKNKLEDIIKDFSNELLNNMLRWIVAKENKDIRSEIITSSIKNSLREAELPNDWKGYDDSEKDYFENREEKKEDIDFDKDIDEILKEIENDPELKIDEEEIEKILKEIEEEEEKEDNNKEDSEIKIDMEGIKKAKKKFKK